MPRKDPRKQYEYIFTPQDGLDTFTFDESVGELRKGLVDKFLKKLPTPKPPSWHKEGDRIAFSSGGGAVGRGSAWTRPVGLSELKRIESAVFYFIEKRELRGGAGAQELRFHVREHPRVGADEDVDSLGAVLHDQTSPTDASWHSHTFDLSDLLRRHEGRALYLTVEIAVESVAAREEENALEFSYRGFALVVNPVNPEPPMNRARA